MTWSCTFDVVPVAWGRAGVSTRGGYVRHYMPKKTEVYEKTIRILAMATRPKKLTGPLKATMVFYLTIPGTLDGKRLKRAEKDALDGLGATNRPDVDNLSKAVLDALEGVVYENDCRVVWTDARKLWSSRPRVNVTIEQVKEEGYGIFQ